MNQIKEVMEYRDGGLYWIKQVQKNQDQTGKRVGYERPDGYRVFRLNGKQYYEHRVIFFLFEDYWPKEIDHKDKNPRNNNIENLVSSDRVKNNTNRRSLNVYKRGDRWQARVQNKHLGMFDCVGQALKKVKKQKEEVLYG